MSADTKTEDRRACNGCGGTGKRYVPWNVPANVGDHPVPYPQKRGVQVCLSCGGSGYWVMPR